MAEELDEELCEEAGLKAEGRVVVVTMAGIMISSVPSMIGHYIKPWRVA